MTSENNLYNNLPGIHFLGMAESFSLFSQKGYMEQNKRFQLDRGVKIHFVGYAGITRECVVYAPNKAVQLYHGENPESVEDWETNPDEYFSDPYLHVDDVVHPISERYGIGTYFDESGELIADDVIERSIIHAEAVIKARAERKQRKAERFARECAKVREEYAGILTPTDGLGEYSKERYKITKANIVALLAREFPGQKFRITQRYKGEPDYGYRFEWTDGPTASEVMKVVNIFELEYKPDWTGDYHGDRTNTAFTSVFGGVEHNNFNRGHSPELIARAAKMMDEALASERYSGSDADKLSLLVVELTGSRLRDNFDNWKRDYWPTHLAQFISAYVKLEPCTAKSSPATKSVSGGVQIIYYSDKALAVVGSTEQIKDDLKALGGRFNPRLTCGAGWIFSKRKEAKLRELLSI